jgi:glycosyltransferase involved in cell wall biosynthesis
MRIHGICVVKNESDIVEHVLTSARRWCDHVYVYDNNSTDGTWEVLQRLAAADPGIQLVRRDDAVFRNTRRAEIFEACRSNASEGDWWCGRLDADEVYIDNPRTFLAAVPNAYETVWSASFQYYFTDEDYLVWQDHPERYAAGAPVPERCRYYRNDWSESRFFRYREGMAWPLDRDWPYAGAVAPQRIRLRHYKYMSPEQMMIRLRDRLEARSRGSQSFKHVARVHDPAEDLNWKKWIQPASSLKRETPDDRFEIDEAGMPPLPKVPAMAARLRSRVLEGLYKAKGKTR